jgi:hypothetical protein
MILELMAGEGIRISEGPQLTASDIEDMKLTPIRVMNSIVS